MKVSVIVPVYNSEKVIEKLINSVISQTYQNYELILVNDGSTDNSLKVLKEFEKKDDRIKVYNKKNTGPGFTRKVGFEKSTGDLIYFVDSDDWITHNSDLEDIVREFENNDIDVLFFDREDISENNKFLIKGFDNMNPGSYDISKLNDIVRPGLGSKIFKSKILTLDMFIESNVFEDLYATYLYLDKCRNFKYVDRTYYTIYHDKESKSLTSTNRKDKEIKSIKIIIELYKKINDYSLKKSLLYRASNIYFSDKVRRILRKEDFTSKEMGKLLNQLGMILKKEKIGLYKKGLLKKIIYHIFLVTTRKGSEE